MVILLFILSYLLPGQDCNDITMNELREQSVELASIDIPSKSDLLEIEDMKEKLEDVLISCAKINFEGKGLIEYRYLENLLEFCKILGDTEGRVKYLRKIGKNPNRDFDVFPDIDAKIDEINSSYGELRIRFSDKNVLKDMATLKNSSGGEVTINILAPVNAWGVKPGERNFDSKKIERKEKYNRLGFIKNQSRDGKLKVYFDSYNDGFFYFVLPYVPYLSTSKNSDGWYAITLDDKKRYRINFSYPRPGEKPDSLIIQPEEGWRLEVSTPEKWVKLTFENPEIRLKFRDRDGKQLSAKENEYLKIVKGNKVDYYIPSDRHIKIEYPSRGEAVWNTVNKALYGCVSLFLIFFITTGVS